MTTYISPQYNGYVYTPSVDLFASLTDGVGAKLRVADPPNVDGQFSAGGLIAARKFSIRGQVQIAATGNVQTDAATFRTELDALKAAHLPGSPAPFWIDSDRYINAEVESLSLGEWSKGLPHLDTFEVGFVATDPFYYQGSAYSPASNSVTLNYGGASPPAANTSRIANPSSAPTVAGASGSTALAGGTYLVAYSYRDNYGETQISPTASVTITAGQQIDVSAVTLPSGANFANVYMSIAAGSSTLAWVESASPYITALPASPNSSSFTTGGTVYCLPIITLVVSSVGAAGGPLIYGVVTGGGVTWSFMLAPTSTGTYIVDCTRQRQRVTLAGADVTNIFTGTFPRLTGNASNSVTIGLSGQAALSSASLTYQNRWI